MEYIFEAVDLANEASCNDLIRLLMEYSIDPMGGGEALPEYAQSNLINELKQRSSVLKAFFARDKATNKAIGFTITIVSFSTFACKSVLNIHDFAVSVEFRKKGVGKFLMNSICDYAKSIGCAKITLEVLQNNEAAKALYSATSFKPYMLDPVAGPAEFWYRPC